MTAERHDLVIRSRIDALHLREAERKSFQRVVGSDDEWPQELVPAVAEREQRQRTERGLAVGQDDAPEDAELTAAVEPRRFDQRIRQVPDVLAHQEICRTRRRPTAR